MIIIDELVDTLVMEYLLSNEDTGVVNCGLFLSVISNYAIFMVMMYSIINAIEHFWGLEYEIFEDS